jgi:beta-lactamase superfamily II metal-dependent hydrolase
MHVARVLVLLGAVALVPLGSAAQRAPASEPGKIVFVNVGQGDGVVIKLGQTIVVSDVGEHKVANVDETLRAMDAERIDVAILSHPHDDHVRNLIALIEVYRWEVEQVVLSDSAWWFGTKTNRRIRELLRDEEVPVQFADRGDRFEWGGGQWLILNPPRAQFTGGSSEAANVSIGYLLTFNDVRALFTGDVEARVARRMAGELKRVLDEPVDILLATHHGSHEGSVKELLEVARPRWAVVSTGPNAFDHPRPEALSRLKAIGATIWCTDVNGSVTARISARGRLTWRASLQVAPWWSGREERQNGTCVNR